MNCIICKDLGICSLGYCICLQGTYLLMLDYKNKKIFEHSYLKELKKLKEEGLK